MAQADRVAQEAAKVEEAHAAIGGFLARCPALDFRVAQLIARWFCSGDKQNYLSYVLHGMPFPRKREVVEERLTTYHPNAEALRATLSEIGALFERRDLAATGLLSKLRGGDYCIKSFSGARFLSDAGGKDILPVSTLPELSERATRLAEQIVAHGDQLADRAA